MLKWFMRRKLAAFERAHGYDASYLHEVLKTDLGAFLKFTKATELGSYRKNVPQDVYFAAKLTSSLDADCGPCTQLGVGFALQAGVAPATVAAVIAGDLSALSADARLGVLFARAVLHHTADVDEHRLAIASRWGDAGVLSVTFAIMSSQLYPTLKYALGHGKACTRVDVAGVSIAPAAAALGAA